MNRHTCAALLCLGCLQLPPAPPEPDAAEIDAGGPVPPRVLAISVRDSRGEPWPDAIPRTARIRIEVSEKMDEAVWLFRGSPDADLIADLAEAPLRAEHRDRAIATRVEPAPFGWTLFPERLERAEIVTVAVAGWARGEQTGLAMGAPYVRELIVSDDPEAGAEVTDSWPADGAASVPPSIPEIAVRFDGPIESAGGLSLALEGVAVAASVRTADCSDVGWDDGWCAAIEPLEDLLPLRAYEIRASEALLDATSAPVGPWSARFATGEADVDPPSLLELPCAIDETPIGGLCALSDDGGVDLRLVASEPVRASLAIDGSVVRAVAPRGDALLRARPLAAGTAFPALLHVTDLAGLSRDVALELSTREPLAAISIVEVRADPMGPEPRQEYVEVLNYGTVPLELAGFSLADDASAMGDVVPSPSVRLAPGQRALIVSDDFDPDDGRDGIVPPGVPLVRVAGSLGSGGLANAGEPLYLRDAMLRRLSAVPAIAAPGACVVRVGEEMRSDASRFEIGPCTPGLGP